MRKTGQVRAIHPDEMVFLHPESGDTRNGSFLTVGEDAYPDVGAGGGQHPRHPAGQAGGALRGMGVPRTVGRSAERLVAEPSAGSEAGTEDLSAGGGAVCAVAREPGVRGLAGRGDPPRAERTGDFGGDFGRSRTGWVGALGEREGTGPDGRPAARVQSPPEARRGARRGTRDRARRGIGDRARGTGAHDPGVTGDSGHEGIPGAHTSSRLGVGVGRGGFLRRECRGERGRFSGPGWNSAGE